MIHVGTVPYQLHPQATRGDIVIGVRCSHADQSVTRWPYTHPLVQLARSGDPDHVEAAMRALCHHALVTVASHGMFRGCRCDERYWMRHGPIQAGAGPLAGRDELVSTMDYCWN